MRRAKTCWLAVMCAAGFVPGACGGGGDRDVDETLTVHDTHPTGSVGGLVLDAVTEGPVAGGAEVVVLAGGAEPQTATTGDDGTFMVDEVSASGNLVVMIEAAGYLPAQVEGGMDNAAGDYPVDNAVLTVGPIGLIPADGVLQLRLVTDTGVPLADVPLTLTTAVRFVTYQQGDPTACGRMVVPATTGADGRASFTGLPDYPGLGGLVDDTVLLTVPPVDLDADGAIDIPGTTRSLAANSAAGGERLVVLDSGLEEDLTVVSSNLSALQAAQRDVPTVLPTDGAIHAVFSLPVDPDALYVRVISDLDEAEVDLDAEADGRFVTVSFGQALAAGAKYHLQLHAVSTAGGWTRAGDFYAPFYTVPQGPPQVIDVRRDPDDGEVVVEFDQPIGTGDASANRNFYGSRCVLWFDAELEGGDPNGLDPGEFGHPSCNLGAAYAFEGDERYASMPGAYLSGYTTRWRFSAPSSSGGTPLPSGTRFSVMFSNVTSESMLVTTPGGTLAPDFEDLAIPD